MTPQEMEECALKVQNLIGVDYLIISRRDFRSYAVSIISSVLLIGGVTFVAVLGVVYSAATAATNRKLNDLEAQASQHAAEVQKIKDKWTAQETVKLRSLEVDRLYVDEKLVVLEKIESRQPDKVDPELRREHIVLSAEKGRPVIALLNDGGLGSTRIEIDSKEGNLILPPLSTSGSK